jgi:transposase
VRRLAAYRGIIGLGALTVASEVCDSRRFPRAAAVTGLLRLTPRVSASGTSTRRGHITKNRQRPPARPTGGVGLGYQNYPAVGLAQRKRQQGLDPAVVARVWAAQLRLCGRR